MSTNELPTVDSEETVISSNLTDSSTQTVIRVYPFILEGFSHYANIQSDKKIQTTLSVKQDLESSKFYSLLRYTPFQDIKEDSLRVIEIPRPRRLQFSSFALHKNLDVIAKMFSLEDDDGVGYICSEVLHRVEHKFTKALKDAEVQTDLMVSPHILDPASQSVAIVYNDSGNQTRPHCRRYSN